jgi:hypothetical protein
VISTALRETLNARANICTSSLLAAPSSGCAAILTRNAPLCSPTISLRDARGTTLTWNDRLPSFSENPITDLIGITPSGSLAFVAPHAPPPAPDSSSPALRRPYAKNTSCQPRSSVPAIAAWNSHRIINATRGEISKVPSGGTIRRNGPSRGSVAVTSKRITRFV